MRPTPQAKRSSMTAAALAVALLAATPVMAQPAPPATRAASSEPTLGHTAAKTTTFMGATTVVLFSIFMVGTGNLVTSTALTAGTMSAAYVIYPANEYLWDHYFPAAPPEKADGSFDVAASLWRNTAKYVTWKVSVVAAKLAWIYAYTGSLTSVVTLGGSTSLALPAVFYINNIAWDWYDWEQHQAPKAAGQTRP